MNGIVEKLNKNSRGFTLLEMMVSLSILMIVSAMCGVSFSRLLVEGNLSTTLELFRFDVRRARSEAASLGGRVIIALNGTSTGYTVGVDYSPYSSTFVADSILYTRNFPSKVIAAFSGTLLFDTRGFVINSSESATSVNAYFSNAISMQVLTVTSTGNVT